MILLYWAMDCAPAGSKGKVKPVYTRFFMSLGVGDVSKDNKLAGLLQLLHDTASQLDGHLAPVGASMHVAVSRMCEADNPLSPAQLRWIRVMDRLGFFCDTDDHACRTVNIGMLYAYGHQEFGALPAADALRISDLRLSAALGRNKDAGGASPSQVAGAAGATAAEHASEAAAAPPQDGPGAAHADARGGESADGRDGPLASIVVPLGGWDVPRPDIDNGVNAARVDMPHADCDDSILLPVEDQAAVAVGVGNELDHDDGSIVIARHAPPDNRTAVGLSQTPSGGAAASKAAADTNASDAVARETRSVVQINEAPIVAFTEQPTIKSSQDAVKCVKAVLEGMASRTDVRDVLEKLVVDSLLCLARVHGSRVADFLAGVIPANVELASVGARSLLHRWWPVWEADAAGVKVKLLLAPPGTVSFLSHPGRRVRGKRWALQVDMWSANDTIQKLNLASSRYFKKENLISCTTVVRVGPNIRPSICASVTTLLSVATMQEELCPVVKLLFTLGRAPLSADASKLGDTCHDFETAGLADRDAALPGRGASLAPLVDGSVAALDARATSYAAEMDDDEEEPHPALLVATRELERSEKEMEMLLEDEKAEEAVACRATRTAVRRLTRPDAERRASSRPPADPSLLHLKPVGLTIDAPPSRVPSAMRTSKREESPSKRRRAAGLPVGGHGGAPGPNPLSLLYLCPPRRPLALPAELKDPNRPGAPSMSLGTSEPDGGGTQRACGTNVPAAGTFVPNFDAASSAAPSRDALRN